MPSFVTSIWGLRLGLWFTTIMVSPHSGQKLVLIYLIWVSPVSNSQIPENQIIKEQFILCYRKNAMFFTDWSTLDFKLNIKPLLEITSVKMQTNESNNYCTAPLLWYTYLSVLAAFVLSQNTISMETWRAVILKTLLLHIYS